MVTSMQLLPIFDKPWCPTTVPADVGGFRDIPHHSTPLDLSNFERLLGDGRKFGFHLSTGAALSDELAQALFWERNFSMGIMRHDFSDIVITGPDWTAHLKLLRPKKGLLRFWHTMWMTINDLELWNLMIRQGGVFGGKACQYQVQFCRYRPILYDEKVCQRQRI
jgi:hypothetical protein